MKFTEGTVVVTGGARGIGKATAEAFASSGANVVVADIDAETARATVDALPTPGLAVQTDVTDEDDVEQLVATARAELGGVDVLVNNAGVQQTIEPTVDQSVADWERVMDVHVKGTYLCSKYAVADMLERGAGAIVNVSSVTGMGGFPYRTAYGPAKAAIRNLTKVHAIEWAQDGVRVNAVAPGYVRTDLVEKLIAEGSVETEKIERRTPVGKFAEPEFVADAIRFLASDHAEYVTGVTLPVDGGWTAYGYF